jgi:hypothetical protein
MLGLGSTIPSKHETLLAQSKSCARACLRLVGPRVPAHTLWGATRFAAVDRRRVTGDSGKEAPGSLPSARGRMNSAR